jgi:hypothetical protein
VREKRLTCPDQANKVNSPRIPVHEHEREVKHFHRVLEEHFPTEGNAMGDIAYQGGLNVDRLCQVSSCQGGHDRGISP